MFRNQISCLIFIIYFTVVGLHTSGQDIISFENQGWNSNQTLDSNFTVGNFLFSANTNLCTNYGENFDVSNISIYSVFRNPLEDQIVISSLDNSVFSLNKFSIYQVSETHSDSLVIEGWFKGKRHFMKMFSNNSKWKILELNYTHIDKIIIRSANEIFNQRIDYNFDNFSFDGLTTLVENSPNSASKHYELSQNYPNPFNPSTLIKYYLPVSGEVSIKIYDIQGNEVSELFVGTKSAGSYSVEFNANSLASGIYIYELRSNDFLARRKMILLK